jgi:chaperonin GroES
MKIKPLSDRVVIEALEAEDKTSGADAGETVKPEVKVGDKVLYGKYSGTDVTVDGKDYLIVRESDILAII